MARSLPIVLCAGCGKETLQERAVAVSVAAPGEAPRVSFYCVSGGERAGCWSSVFAAMLGAERALGPRPSCELKEGAKVDGRG